MRSRPSPSGLELGVPFERIAPGLREFQGAERRVRGARRAERHPRRRRLRPSSDRDRRGARRGACAQASHRGGVPAAPLLADGSAVRRVRPVAGRRGPRRAHGHLRGRRRSDSRRRPRGPCRPCPLAGERAGRRRAACSTMSRLRSRGSRAPATSSSRSAPDPSRPCPTSSSRCSIGALRARQAGAGA